MIVLRILWQLPQTLVGLIMLAIWKRHIKYIDRGNITYYLIDLKYGVSFGRIVFLPEGYGTYTLWHEYGHSKQSLYLGPLYLILVGLPSIVFNIISSIIGGKFAEDYYKRYPENWADKLGNVKR